ncbi:MAG: MbcA/ParS/Xre antitoxin family protein [Burkholderiales bacterium]
MSTVLDKPVNSDRRSRKRLARVLVALFDHWQIAVADQASLLGLSTDSRATVARYRKGEPLAGNTDLLARAAHLLGIHQSLRIMFAHDRDLAYRWVCTANRRFNDRAPLEIMRKGYEGILVVRRHLDFERSR